MPDKLLPEPVYKVVSEMVDGVTSQKIEEFAVTLCDISITEDNQEVALEAANVVELVKNAQGINKRDLFSTLEQSNHKLVVLHDLMHPRPGNN